MVYLLGCPVSHSVSPAIFTEAFLQTGINAQYTALFVPPEALAREVKRLREEGSVGFNLTVPHKRAVMPFLDHLDSTAREVGAVNSVSLSGTTSVGYNTDLAGLRSSFSHLHVPDISGKAALLLGSGGAARAAAVCLAQLDARSVLIANRTLEKAAELAVSLQAVYPNTEFGATDLVPGPGSDAIGDISLCIQATSLGLSRKDPLPLDPAVLPPGCFAYDLVYGRGETAFVRRARQVGLAAADGREMLIRQAAEAFGIWFKEQAPLEAMRKGLTQTLERAVTT